nr:MAG TPA: hypothetical protein [Caudoviricetes sp.]
MKIEPEGIDERRRHDTHACREVRGPQSREDSASLVKQFGLVV